ncbi:Putative adhesin precursor SprC [Tenacibaculum amylolyticum]
MCKYVKLNFKFALWLTLMMFSLFSYAQTLEPIRTGRPTAGGLVDEWTSLCATDGFNNFHVTFNFSGGIFQADNRFRIVMSDETGDFNNSTEVGATDNSFNTAFFDVTGSFRVPDGTYGTGYRLRIESTNPVMTGPEFGPFEAYKITSQQLILNDFNDVVLCGGTPETITLNEIDPSFTYRWYRNNTLISGQTGLSLTVSQPGEYYAEINYGSCRDAVLSNRVNVSSITPGNLTIEGGDTVDICANESYELVASIDDPAFTYRWFKDGVEITGLPPYSPSYTTPTSNQFGVYHLEIEVGGCSSRSQDVTVRQKSDTTFEVTLTSDPTQIIFPGETIQLGVDHNATGSVSIRWFKDGVLIPGVSGTPINAVTPGVYQAEVTETTGACPVSKLSPEYTILGVNDMAVTIRTGTDFQECVSERTELSMVGIRVTATDGNEYDISQDKIDKLCQPDAGGAIILRLQWFKDTVAIAGAEAKTFNVTSYNDNGEYYLNITVGTLTADSNIINLLLGVGEIEITSSSSSNSLCPGESIFLSIGNFAGYTYTWFKDGTEITVADSFNVEVTEVGSYSVTLDGFGCQINVAEVEIVEFDDTVLEVSPSTNAVLPTGGSVTLEASGADSYEWYDEAGNLLSTNETLDVNALGTYTVIGTVGGCTAQREVNVIEDDGMLIIPNIISPFNGDGVNDTWELPNRFAFQTNVQVIIFNSAGKEVLNTTDYQNDWPVNNNLRDGMLFYFKVIKDNSLVKAGTISILQ